MSVFIWLQVRRAVSGGRTQPEAAFAHSRAASVPSTRTARDGPSGRPSGAQLPASCQHCCLLLPMCVTLVPISPHISVKACRTWWTGVAEAAHGAGV